MSTRRVYIQIYGRVQGVFFRQSAQDEALRLGLLGWVRNRVDGSVEATAEGAAGSVSEFLDWCHHGPPAAQVDEVSVQDRRDTEPLHKFRVEPTIE